MAQVGTNFTLCGLASNATSVSTAGAYKVIVSLTLPKIEEGSPANSAVVTTISQNGSPVFTSNAGDLGTLVSLTCAANDTISVALSSAAAVDQGLNVVRGTVAIG